jgi:hypothetical protein
MEPNVAHEREDSRAVDSIIPNRAAVLSFVRTAHNSRNTPISSVLPQQDRIVWLFKPTFLRLEGYPQSCPPLGSMCRNEAMSVSNLITAIFSVDAMRRSGAVCGIRRLIAPQVVSAATIIGTIHASISDRSSGTIPLERSIRVQNWQRGLMATNRAGATV